MQEPEGILPYFLNPQLQPGGVTPSPTPRRSPLRVLHVLAPPVGLHDLLLLLPAPHLQRALAVAAIARVARGRGVPGKVVRHSEGGGPRGRALQPRGRLLQGSLVLAKKKPNPVFGEPASKGWLSNRMAAWLSCCSVLLAEVINAIHNWDRWNRELGKIMGGPHGVKHLKHHPGGWGWTSRGLTHWGNGPKSPRLHRK